MRYLIAGGQGMLGHDLVRALSGRDVVALGRDELDVTDPDSVELAVRGADVVVNSAAFTRVDDAESDEAAATLVNATGAGLLAAAASARGARFVQVSTDYVFDGRATEPYAEDSPLHPSSAYGRSKAEGERRVRASHPGAHIIRTAWLYGEHGPNFAKTMLRLAQERETVSVVNDQIGQPTWSFDVARQIVLMLDADAPGGIYHATNSGQASWFDFARAVFAQAGLDPERILPVDSTSFVRPAPRPAYSVLGHGAWNRVGLPHLRPWRDALAAAVEEGALAHP